MKIVKNIFKYIVAFLLSLFLFLSWVFTTESGLQWGWAQFIKFKPNELSVVNVSGQLNEQLVLHQLKWQSNDLDIAVDLVMLECDWLSLLSTKLICDKIDAGSVVHWINQESNQFKQTFEMFELGDMPIPIKLNLHRVFVERYLRKNATDKNSTLTDITPNNELTQLSINQLKTNQSKINFELLKLGLLHQEQVVQLQAKGEIDLQGEWFHQLDVVASTPKFSFQFKTKGELRKDSQFSLTTQKPYVTESSGQWYWQRGLFINKGELKMSQQRIVLNSIDSKIEQLKANIELHWPQLKVNAGLEIDQLELKGLELSESERKKHDLSGRRLNGSKIKDLNLNAELNVMNVLDWRQELDLKSSITSHLSSEVYSFVRTVGIDLGVSIAADNNQTDLPVDAKISVKVMNGEVSASSEDSKIGGLFFDLKVKADLKESIAKHVSIEGNLRVNSLTPILGYPVQGLNAAFSASQVVNGWIVNTKGQVADFQHPDWSVNQLNWNVQMNEVWSAKIKADSMKYHVKNGNALSPNQLSFSAAKLDLSGTSDKHHLQLSFLNNEQQKVSLDLEGEVLSAEPFNINKGSPKWLIKKLKALIPYEQRIFTLTARDIILDQNGQQVEQICINGQGQVCFKGSNGEQGWLAETELKQLDLNSFLAVSKNWGIHLPATVQGQINGVFILRGVNNKIEKLQVDLESSDLFIKDDLWQSHWHALNIKSENSNVPYVLNINWSNVNASVNMPNWLSKVEAPQGSFRLNISPNLDFSLKLEQSNLAWIMPYSPHKPQSSPMQIPLAQLQAKLNSNQLSADLKVDFMQSDHITANMITDWPFHSNGKIEGQLNLAISQLDWVKQWQSRIDEIEAKWQQNIVLSGTLNNPSVEGMGDVFIKRFTIEEIGLDIHDSVFTLNSLGQALTLNGLLKNKQGELKVNGNVALFPTLAASGTIQGVNLILLDKDENKIIVTPDIKANWNNNHLKVNGSLYVEEANIHINRLPKQAINVSEDQVIISQNEITESPFTYSIQLNLDAGKKVKIDSFGLNSGVKGQIEMVAQSGKPIKLNGQLAIEKGQFTAYKQVLIIKEGQLFFLGSAENPGIQFKAIRQLDDVLVGVIADGTLANPRLTLYSEPTMAEENILALLLTGRSIESLSQKEGNALANAALSLGVERANVIVQKLGTMMGIKNLAISTKTKSDTTRVDVGAKINDRLSVGYGTTINSQNEMDAGWIIVYQFSKNIAFEATSGEEVSTSVSYKKQMDSLFDNNKERAPDKNENKIPE